MNPTTEETKRKWEEIDAPLNSELESELERHGLLDEALRRYKLLRRAVSPSSRREPEAIARLHRVNERLVVALDDREKTLGDLRVRNRILVGERDIARRDRDDHAAKCAVLEQALRSETERANRAGGRGRSTKLDEVATLLRGAYLSMDAALTALRRCADPPYHADATPVTAAAPVMAADLRNDGDLRDE